MSHLQHKHILITGGGSGIGAQTAKLLASRHAMVGVADINEESAKQVVADIHKQGGKAYSARVDVTQVDDVARMFDHAVTTGGNIDVLVNNAGIDHLPAPMAEIEDDVYLKNIAVNLNGVWFCMKYGLRHMLANGHGQIVNIASVAGLRSAPLVAAYSAAKHGVIGLTKSAAVEYARQNIRINAVCPSFVNTPMVQGILNKVDESMARKITGANPMKRLGEPQEIAFAIAWLCSDESSFMTGQSVVLDGGMLA